MVLYFDLMTMPKEDMYRAFDAGRKFIQSQMAEPDMMAILIFYKNVVRVFLDFTDDREMLDLAIQTLIKETDDEEGDILAQFYDVVTYYFSNLNHFCPRSPCFYPASCARANATPLLCAFGILARLQGASANYNLKAPFSPVYFSLNAGFIIFPVAFLGT